MTSYRMTKRITSTPAGWTEAGEMLKAGKLVAFPTETVYGLGADATNAEAIAALYAAKGRPTFNPLIVHVDSLASARKLAPFGIGALAVANAYWPGPLTLVLRRRPDCPVSELASAGMDTIALRVPSDPIAQAIIAAAGVPIAAPSANRSGRVSPTEARHVISDLDGKIDGIVVGPSATIGVESTILSFLTDPPTLLRPGAVTREFIEQALGHRIQLAGGHGADGSDPNAPVAPGQLESHYAPGARVRLNAEEIQAGEAALLFGPYLPHGIENARLAINLSETGDTIEAAARLFTALRELDASGARTIAIMPIPDFGLGEAINDRLKRAAAPRP